MVAPPISTPLSSTNTEISGVVTPEGLDSSQIAVKAAAFR
jgi:hypothetical protein